MSEVKHTHMHTHTPPKKPNNNTHMHAPPPPPHTHTHTHSHRSGHWPVGRCMGWRCSAGCRDWGAEECERRGVQWRWQGTRLRAGEGAGCRRSQGRSPRADWARDSRAAESRPVVEPLLQTWTARLYTLTYFRPTIYSSRFSIILCRTDLLPFFSTHYKVHFSRCSLIHCSWSRNHAMQHTHKSHTHALKTEKKEKTPNMKIPTK